MGSDTPTVVPETAVPQVTPAMPVAQQQMRQLPPTKQVEWLFPQGNALLVKLTMTTIQPEVSGVPPTPEQTIQQVRPTATDTAVASGTVIDMGPLVRKTTWSNEGTVFFDLAVARRFTWDGQLLAIVSEDAIYASRNTKTVEQRYKSLSETLAAKK